MIELERHIEILLLSNDCVIVPGLGGFVAHYVEAHYNPEEQLFLPPLRTLGFNPQLKMNDSLLAQSYIEAYDLSYPEAIRRIEGEVEELKQHLETEGYYELNDIGTISLNDEGRYVFTPCEAGILTPELYGLSSLNISYLSESNRQNAPREKAPTRTIPMAAAADDKEQKVADEIAAETDTVVEDEEESTEERAVVIKMSWIRNAVAVAAAILCFFFISSPISNGPVLGDVQHSSILPVTSFTDTALHNDTLAALTTETTDSVEVAENADNTDVEAEASKEEVMQEQAEQVVQTEEIKTKTEAAYVIVLASQISKRNATLFVDQLHEEGFKDARIYTHNNMVRVVYGSYASEAEAYNDLCGLRSNKHFQESWIYKQKND